MYYQIRIISPAVEEGTKEDHDSLRGGKNTTTSQHVIGGLD
jgi:hypothetical protein